MSAWAEVRERLVKVAPGRLGLTTRLPSGKPITVPLDRLNTTASG